MAEMTTKEWCLSRDIPWKEAIRITSQIKAHYCDLGKYLNGRPVAIELVERELIQLVRDVQVGRFPVKSSAKNP